MALVFQRYFRAFYLLVPVLLGLALGHLAATSVGVLLTPPVRIVDQGARAVSAPLLPPKINDYEVIVQRNIFDSTAPGVMTLASAPPLDNQQQAAPPQARPNMALLGTVTRGDLSLAVIRTDNEVKTYRQGGETPGGGVLEEVARLFVTIKFQDGSTLNLPLHDVAGDRGSTPVATGRGRAGAGAAAPPAAPSDEAVRSIGENRWSISREEAERARGNLNELLKQARMEPRIIDGRTEGFVVRMIQPRSLLALLGIQRGDVLMQVNGVELDSPEKALQIFQQLREARSISIGLMRNEQRMNFDYQID
jgi:general secretion pathway protein C